MPGENQAPVPAPSVAELLTGIPRLDRSTWDTMTGFQRWLVMVRAPVLVMTLSATMAGILLALVDGYFQADRLIALLTGLTLAHATNNLVNDWVDHRQGVDRENYFRRQYGTHVLEDRFVSQPVFLIIMLITGLVAAACGFYLYLVAGTAVLTLTLVGAFFVLFYTWPLKHVALGEISVLLVWGPMIVAGSYFVISESVNLTVMLLSLVFGIGPTLVILGKHMDKRPQDLARSIRTLPVVCGALLSRQICLGLLASQWLMLAALTLLGNYWLLLCLTSVPAMIPMTRALMTEPPSERPADYPEETWPLWYAALTFRYCRDFGLLLLVGLVLAVIF
ncbi:MAG: prenyltransferase [Proteobacteria bacterium]|nr:prenyltransferase [Pseudomonadota bacterium]